VEALIETEAGRLGTLARALAGDTEGTARLLAAARMATDRFARRRSSHPEADVQDIGRAALVRAHLRTARDTGAGHERLPDPDLETVRARLDALASLPRAVLVLRHFEELTLADLARVTERSGTAVARALETATAAVGATGYQLDQVAAAVRLPEPGQVETARRRLESRRRRVRGRWFLAALVVAVLVTGATVLPGLLRPDPYARALGTWVYGYEVRPAAGVRVVNRFLTPDADTVQLLDEDRNQAERRTCDITATSSERPAEAPAGRATRVGVFAGRFLAANADRGPALWWRPGPRLAMEVHCSQEPTDADLLAIAALVVPAEVPVLVPVDLSGLPAGEEVRGIYDVDGQLVVLVLPPGETPQSLYAAYVSVGTIFSTAAYQQDEFTVQLGSVTAQVQRAGETTTICWDLGGPQACVADFIRQDDPAASRTQRLERLVAIARAVRTAPGATDRSTWFDARDAVPR
jgi:DNA-directed RNA polymerase specialized sigma24 family protein